MMLEVDGWPSICLVSCTACSLSPVTFTPKSSKRNGMVTNPCLFGEDCGRKSNPFPNSLATTSGYYHQSQMQRWHSITIQNILYSNGPALQQDCTEPE